MKARIKKENSRTYLELPDEIASAFSNSYEAEIYNLRPGMLMACILPVKNEVFSQNSQPPVAGFSLSAPEQALVSKLSRIRFFERTEETVAKTLNEEERKILSDLIQRKVITLFKNAKYPKGVYNISNRIFFANKSQVQASDSPTQTFNANSIPGPALAINTIEHLKKLGYMVLSNEGEAKYQMQNIKTEIKDDEVKGVRGFDKKYYILRKSFLLEFEQPIFDLLEQGLIHANEIGEKLKLTPEAITVILMVMADEGLVIEKRRGEWAKA